MDESKVPSLWAHQKEAVKRAVEQGNFALFHDMGTGKTRTLVEIMRSLMNSKGKFLRTSIFCPQIVVPNWRDEIEKYSKVGRGRVLLCGSGSAKQRRTRFQKWQKDYPDGFVSVFNYEVLLMSDLYEAIGKWAPEIIIFDESHRCKNHETKRSKAAYFLANPWDRTAKKYLPKPSTFIATGTPILNSPEDIFMQFKILDGGRTFGENYHVFKRTYFADRNSGMPGHVHFPDWQLKTLTQDGMDGLAAIKDKIKTLSMYVEKKDCLDLPPFVRKTIHVEMSQEQRRHYDEMKKDFITYTQDAACVASLAITKMLRLNQIVTGHLPVVDIENPENSKIVNFRDIPRITTLGEILVELTPRHKVLVWAVWRENYSQIRALLEKLKIQFVEVHGDVPNKQKFENVDKFKNDIGVRVLLGNPRSGGIGINLTDASYSIFYSRNNSLEDIKQATDRNYRGGSERHESITCIDLVCPGTVDELILENLSNKQEVSLKILKNNIDRI